MAGNRRQSTIRIGSRTGLRLLDNKTIRRNSRGKEIFDDYFTEGETDTDASDVVDRSLPSPNSHQKSVSNLLPASKRIGSRTGLRLLVGKTIRRNSRGKEIFDDYFTDGETEADASSEKSNPSSPQIASAALPRKSSVKHSTLLESPGEIRPLPNEVFRGDTKGKDYVVDGSLIGARADSNKGDSAHVSRKSVSEPDHINGKSQKIGGTPVQRRKLFLAKEEKRSIETSFPHTRRLQLSPSSIPAIAQSSRNGSAVRSPPVAGLSSRQKESSSDSSSSSVLLLSNANFVRNTPNNADSAAIQAKRGARARTRLSFPSPVAVPASPDEIITPTKRPALHASRLPPSVLLSFSSPLDKNPIDDELEIEDNNDIGIDNYNFRLSLSRKDVLADEFSESDHDKKNSAHVNCNATESGRSDLRSATRKGRESLPTNTAANVHGRRSGEEHLRTPKALPKKRKSTQIDEEEANNENASARKKKFMESIGNGMESSLKDISDRRRSSLAKVYSKSATSKGMFGKTISVSFAREDDSDDSGDMDSSKRVHNSSTTKADLPKTSVVLSPVRISVSSGGKSLPKTPYNSAMTSSRRPSRSHEVVNLIPTKVRKVGRPRKTAVAVNIVSDGESCAFGERTGNAESAEAGSSGSLPKSLRRRHDVGLAVLRKNSIIGNHVDNDSSVFTGRADVQSAAVAGPSHSSMKSPSLLDQGSLVHSKSSIQAGRPRRISLAVNKSDDESSIFAEREDVSRASAVAPESPLRHPDIDEEEANNENASAQKKKLMESIGNGMASSLKVISDRRRSSLAKVDSKSAKSEGMFGKRIVVSFAREDDSGDMDSSQRVHNSPAASRIDQASLLFDALVSAKSSRNSSTTKADLPKSSVVLSPVHIPVSSGGKSLPKTPYNSAVTSSRRPSGSHEEVNLISTKVRKVGRPRKTAVAVNIVSDGGSSTFGGRTDNAESAEAGSSGSSPKSLRRRRDVGLAVLRKNSIIGNHVDNDSSIFAGRADVQSAAVAGPSHSSVKSPSLLDQGSLVHSKLSIQAGRPQRISLAVNKSDDESSVLAEREDVSSASAVAPESPITHPDISLVHGESNKVGQPRKSSDTVNEADKESSMFARRELAPDADAGSSSSPARLLGGRQKVNQLLGKSKELGRSRKASADLHEMNKEASVIDGRDNVTDVAATTGSSRPAGFLQEISPEHSKPKKRGRPRKNGVPVNELNNESSSVIRGGMDIPDVSLARASNNMTKSSNSGQEGSGPRKTVNELDNESSRILVGTDVAPDANVIDSLSRPVRSLRSLQDINLVHSPAKAQSGSRDTNVEQSSSGKVLDGERHVVAGTGGLPSRHESDLGNIQTRRDSKKLSSLPKDPILVMCNPGDESSSVQWGRRSNFVHSTDERLKTADSPLVSPSASPRGTDKQKKQKNNEGKKAKSKKALRELQGSPHLVYERPKRPCFKPLEFWRNERIIYRLNLQRCPSFVGVDPGLDPSLSVFNIKTKSRQNKVARKKNDKKKPTSDTSDGEEMKLVLDEAEMERNHFVHQRQRPILVINPVTKAEVLIDCVKVKESHVMVSMTGQLATPNDGVVVCKPLIQKGFASGVLELKPHTSKGMSYLKTDTIVFHVIQGLLEVTIHDTIITVVEGDQFFIPHGNKYDLQNTSDRLAKLVFFQLVNPVSCLPDAVE